MPTFTDNQDHVWDVAVNVAVLRRVRSRLGVDLMGLGTTDPPPGPDPGAPGGDCLLARLVKDPALLCDVIYVVCQEQAEAGKISDEQFGARMAGDAIEAATRALLEGIVNFFPSRRDRERIKRAIAALWTIVETVQDELDARTSPAELKREAQKILAKLPKAGSSSTNAPGSSA